MSDERALIESAVRGDPDALEQLATARRPLVRRTAAALLGDDDAAEDVAQEVLVRLHASLPGFRQEAELSTWLHRVTINLCQDHLRRTRRRDEIPLGTLPQANAPRVEDRPEQVLDSERARAAIRAAIERLPPDLREAVTLRYLADLPYVEIARITGAPPGTVASRIFRALARLGEDLEPRHLEVIK